MSSFDRTVYSLCNEIDHLNETLDRVIEERDKFQRLYSELLDSSIKHGQDMAGQVLNLLLNKGNDNVQ